MKSKSRREELIDQGLKIVNKEFDIFSRRFRLYNYVCKEDLEDMRSDAILIMIGLVDKFDETRGIKLISYITQRIRGSFVDFLRNNKKSYLRTQEYIEDVVRRQIDEFVESQDLQDSSHQITDQDIKSIYYEMYKIDPDNAVVILDAINNMPKHKVDILVEYYVLNKNIKEMSESLNFSPDSGWVYRIKKEAIEHIKAQLYKYR